MLEYTSFEKYNYIKAQDGVSEDSLIDLYESIFQKLEGQEQVFFLIDAVVQPSLLGMDAYAQILAAADRHNIGHIEMSVVTQDNARHLIWAMVKELASNYQVDVNVSCFSTAREAQQVLETLIQGAEYLAS